MIERGISKFYEIGYKEAKGDPDEGGCIAFVGWDEESIEDVDRQGKTSLLHNAYEYCGSRLESYSDCGKTLAPVVAKELIERNLGGYPEEKQWATDYFTNLWKSGCAEYIEKEITRELG